MTNKHVTDTNFEQEVLAGKVPVLVNFWAPWCTPCQTVAPVVEEVAGHFKGEVKVVKVNTDESPRVSRDYKIHSIPTLVIFNSGQHIDRVAGVVH